MVEIWRQKTSKFVSDGAADIRIAFIQGDGSWSTIGTDSLSITNENEPTMNYGWLTPNYRMTRSLRWSCMNLDML